MKKGSKAQKCKVCGEIIFWKFSQQDFGIMQTMGIKTIKPWHISNTKYGYMCDECKDKELKGEPI